jgi:MYXO-CTERM domain-containing protein
MGIVNRRNAFLGWVAWKVGKGMARKKAKGVMPGKSQSSSGKRKPAMFAGLAAALGGAAWLRRKRKGGDSPES